MNKTKVFRILLLSCCLLVATSSLIGVNAAENDTEIELSCWCDECANFLGDKCSDEECTLKGALLEEVGERADDSVMPEQPDCDSCLVSCLRDDVSLEQTEKQLRCQKETTQWKRVQLCRARQREAPIFFKHIHKAGGVFLCNMLARKNMKVSENANCVPGSMADYCELQHYSMQKQAKLPSNFPDLEFFSMESPLPSNWAWGTFAWITMLRRPEDRTLSAYYWWLQQQNDKKKRFSSSDGVLMKLAPCENYTAPHPGMELAREGTIATLSDNFEKWLTAYPDNQMVRGLCGVGTCDVPKGQLTQAHLNCAKSRLDKFAVVLVLERIDDSLEMLRKVLNWNNVKTQGTHPTNKRLGKGTPTDATDELKPYPDVLSMLNDMHNLDWELYDYANDILDDMLEKTVGFEDYLSR